MKYIKTLWTNKNNFQEINNLIDKEYQISSMQYVEEFFNQHQEDFIPAVDLILKIIEEEKPILVSGDYDVDGMTATAIVYKSLKDIYDKVYWFVPDRITQGYGLHPDVVKEKLTSPGLVITVDTGISEFDHVQEIKALGHKVIVTDHHLPDTDKLPCSDALIDPKIWNEEGTTDYLASGGTVAAKLMYHLKKIKGETAFDPFVMQLVALGILSDVIELNVPMKHLLQYGLTLLQSTDHPGLRALFKLCRISEEAPITTQILSFNILPKLNAAGRMGQSFKGVELLLTPMELDGTAEAHSLFLATELLELNQTRKTIENAIYVEAMDQAVQYSYTHSNSIVVYKEGWHPGVLGIVAARLMEQFYRPTVVMTNDCGLIKGSCRSVEDFDIYNVLKQCGDAVAEFGGHAVAAGITLEKDGLKKFQEAFEHTISTVGLPTEKVYEYNDTLTFDQCQDIPFLVSLNVKEPVGNKNSEWLFRLEPSNLRFIGNSGASVALLLKNNEDQILIVKKFRPQQKYDIYVNTVVDVLVTPIFTYFGGTVQVEWRLVDIKTHKEEDNTNDSADA